jgi:hypothetical protein
MTGSIPQRLDTTLTVMSCVIRLHCNSKVDSVFLAVYSILSE